MKTHGALLVILGAALWGTDAVFRWPLTAALSPVTIVFLEHCILSMAVIPLVVKFRRQFLVLLWRDYLALVVIALGGSAAATILFTFSVKQGNPSVVILLQKTQPLFTILLARLALGEKPPAWFWPWSAAAVAGAVLVSAPDWQPDQMAVPTPAAAVFSAIGAAALWGSATVSGRYIVSRVSVRFLTALRFLFALPALAILYRLQPAVQRELPSDFSPLAIIVAMALMPGLAALLIYYKGLQSTTASLASICELSFPVTAVAVNWLLLGVRLSALQLFGSAILVISVTAMVFRNSRDPGGQARLRQL